MPDAPAVACVALVDDRGWLLLQERDEHAPVDPDRWGWVGGGVEVGESVLTAARRELTEETGLTADELVLVADEQVWCAGHGRSEQFALFVAATEATDDDVVCGEGRQIVFVDPLVAVGLPLTGHCARTLAPFLASTTYGRLALRP